MLLGCSQSPAYFFISLLGIKCFLVPVAILVAYIPRGRSWGYRSEGRVASSQTMPCSVSRFDSHSRWPPLMQSARSRQSYGKIGDHEQSKTFVLIIQDKYPIPLHGYLPLFSLHVFLVQVLTTDVSNLFRILNCLKITNLMPCGNLQVMTNVICFAVSLLLSNQLS